MRLAIASALAAAAAFTALALPAQAAPLGAAPSVDSNSGVVLAGSRGNCKPYNGPYGFYGNPFCTGSFTENYPPPRNIWTWEDGRSYWGSADDNPPPRRVKRRAYQ